MDWFTVLLFVIFIVLPLLQQFLGKDKPSQPPSSEQRDEWDWELPPMPESGERNGRDVPRPARSESEPIGAKDVGGWGGEISDVADEEIGGTLGTEDIPPTERTLELPPLQPRTQPRVVSLEALEIDRAAEHKRFHDRFVAPAPPAMRPRRGVRSFSALRNPREIRRAIILAEVLGPPRAIRPIEPEIGTH